MLQNPNVFLFHPSALQFTLLNVVDNGREGGGADNLLNEWVRRVLLGWGGGRMGDSEKSVSI